MPVNSVHWYAIACKFVPCCFCSFLQCFESAFVLYGSGSSLKSESGSQVRGSGSRMRSSTIPDKKHLVFWLVFFCVCRNTVYRRGSATPQLSLYSMFRLPNCVLLPHLGSADIQTRHSICTVLLTRAGHANIFKLRDSDNTIT